MFTNRQSHVRLLAAWLLIIPLAAYGQTHQHQHGDTPEHVSGSPLLKNAPVTTATFDNKGRLWLVWVFGSHLYVNHSDDLGQTFSAPVRVNSEPMKIHHNGEARPKIAIDNAGRIFIAYTQKLDKRFTGHIRFSRSIDGGNSFSTPRIVNDNHDIISHRFVSMALDKSGAIHLSWLDGRDFEAAKKAAENYQGSALYYALSKDQGRHFSVNKKLADNTCQCCRIALTLNQIGQPVLLWRHIFEDNNSISRDHGLMQLGNQGQPGKLQRVSYQNWNAKVCPHHGPTLAISDDGRNHMAWFNHHQNEAKLYYAYSDANEEQPSKSFEFAEPNSQAQHPDLLTRGKQVYLVWKQFDGVQSRIYLRQSADAGRHWGDAKVIATTSESSDYPYLLKDGDSVFISWQTQAEGYRLIRLPGQP